MYSFQILSRDSVTVAVDAIMYYRIFDPVMSVCNVENAHHSTSLLAATTLRNVLGTKNMSEILTERESIAQSMQVKHLHGYYVSLYDYIIGTQHSYEHESFFFGRWYCFLYSQ